MQCRTGHPPGADIRWVGEPSPHRAAHHRCSRGQTPPRAGQRSWWPWHRPLPPHPRLQSPQSRPGRGPGGHTPQCRQRQRARETATRKLAGHGGPAAYLGLLLLLLVLEVQGQVIQVEVLAGGGGGLLARSRGGRAISRSGAQGAILRDPKVPSALCCTQRALAMTGVVQKSRMRSECHVIINTP